MDTWGTCCCFANKFSFAWAMCLASMKKLLRPFCERYEHILSPGQRRTVSSVFVLWSPIMIIGAVETGNRNTSMNDYSIISPSGSIQIIGAFKNFQPGLLHNMKKTTTFRWQFSGTLFFCAAKWLLFFKILFPAFLPILIWMLNCWPLTYIVKYSFGPSVLYIYNTKTLLVVSAVLQQPQNNFFERYCCNQTCI